MTRPRIQLLALAGSVLIQPGQSIGECLRYSVELVNAPCLPGSAIGHGLNDSGVIAGDYGCLAFDDRAFFWDGRLIPIPTPLEQPDSRALDVNNTLHVVGWMRDYDVGSSRRGFLYHDGRTLDLGTLPGGNYSEALSINDAGIVCGYWGNSVVGNPALLAFIWDGQMADLSLPTGPNNVANDINTQSVICGWMGQIDYLNATAFLWNDGVVTEFGIPTGAQATEAKALNDLNQVCGVIHYPNHDGPLIRKPFVWVDGVMTELPVLPGYVNGFALDIANGGTVIGYCTGGQPEGDIQPAFIWRDGVMTSLGDLIPDDSEVTLVTANAINNAGQITGRGSIDGDDVAFLLTPIPPAPGDVNCDWLVNIDDLFDVIAAWGPCGKLGPCNADLDSTGAVDIDDLFTVIANWI
jgi:probable HAF family extracellular repeat protein